ncbi:ciliary microtubule associated protein 1A-like [Linepithema humile]|uniref:ciliary microtubule associated protein 1A-like n=1 Tax=Linepithema humile TaxID=83485 RepID=UPI00351F27A3
MPPKRERKKGRGGKKAPTEMKGAATCRFITPGPQYELKTLVGYRNHCVSRYRNPAYTFGGRRITFEVAEGPGPKYTIEERRPKGFSFGLAARYRDIVLGPGPKYKLPDVPRGPFFSLKWRTKSRKIDETPGPYYIKPIADAPAFSMGLRTVVTKPPVSADHYSPYNLEAVKPRTPMYTMVGRRELRMISKSPGPIYGIPSVKPTPAYSFGVKHSECAPPYITECDE